MTTTGSDKLSSNVNAPVSDEKEKITFKDDTSDQIVFEDSVKTPANEKIVLDNRNTITVGLKPGFERDAKGNPAPYKVETDCHLEVRKHFSVPWHCVMMSEDQTQSETNTNTPSEPAEKALPPQPEEPEEVKEPVHVRRKRNVISVPLRGDFRDHKGNVVQPFE
ncbi:hypothetical protein FQR65_LT06527 [Abscondita terminalis]|nr:hypothetical protein FQR65_LT06527 [Abscondita terminalis]